MKNKHFPSFQEALKKHLSDNKDDITSLADRAEVSRDALYKVKYGKTKSPSLEVVVKVAQAYNETVEQFIGIHATSISPRLYSLISQLSHREQEILAVMIETLPADQTLDTIQEKQS